MKRYRTEQGISMRWKLIGILSLATGLTLLILYSFYFKMLIDLPAFRWLSVTTAFAGLLSAFVVYGFTRPIVADIEALAETARTVASGDFDAHVQVRSRGELAALAEAFNTMAGEVRTLFDQRRRGEVARRNLVANVTHDLRTPLTATTAMVQALRDGVVEDAATRERYLRTIGQEMSYMSRLIRDLSDLLQLESGQIRLQRESVNLEDVLAEVLETFGVTMEERGAVFRVTIPPGAPSLWVDATRLRQALTNIIQNAVSYTPPDGAISIVAQALTRSVRLTVADQGPGIPADLADQVFERFYRADTARSRGQAGEGGMGLGLAIARDILELHGGRAGINPDTATGAEVWIEFPLALGNEVA